MLQYKKLYSSTQNLERIMEKQLDALDPEEGGEVSGSLAFPVKWMLTAFVVCGWAIILHDMSIVTR